MADALGRNVLLRRCSQHRPPSRCAAARPAARRGWFGAGGTQLALGRLLLLSVCLARCGFLLGVFQRELKLVLGSSRPAR